MERSLPRFTSYQRRLFILLSVANFFEGYDFLALGQILPNLRAEMGLSQAAGGLLVTVIGLGTIAAYGVVRLADQRGRRPIMMITILGYALFSGLTGLARGPWDFAAYQLVARVFLIAEWALAMVYAAEEFPAERRGFAIGVLQAWSAMGSIVCAGVVPLLLQTPYGWRSVYFVGIIPLLLLAYARRGLRETERFEAVRAGRRVGGSEGSAGRRVGGSEGSAGRRVGGSLDGPHVGLMRIWHTPYRKRVVQLALIWGLTYMCTQCAVFFWKEFAVAERGMTDGQVGLAIAVASLVSLPLVFMVGKLLDGWGRRPGAVLIYVLLATSVVAAYQLNGYWALTVALTVAIFSAAAVLVVLNSFTTELFPTAMRGDAFAWSNNLLGRIGYVIAPAIVGWAAGRIGWGDAVSLTAVTVVAALFLIVWWLPETARKELEETGRP
ncbi:MAG: MFS transporter [Gemmatimonadetes bacterium]|nr:MFS transporter [Gemmatimonadota bacterium]